jgi:hypothetical protein
VLGQAAELPNGMIAIVAGTFEDFINNFLYVGFSNFQAIFKKVDSNIIYFALCSKLYFFSVHSIKK